VRTSSPRVFCSRDISSLRRALMSSWNSLRARSNSRAPSRRSFSARVRCSSVMVALSFCSLSCLAFRACCCACRVRSRGANSARMASSMALPCGDSSRSRFGSTTPILGSAQAGNVASATPAAINHTANLLLIKRFTELLPRMRLFVIRARPQAAARPKRVVSRRTRLGGSILSERIADRKLEALGLVSPLGQPVAVLGIERHAEAEAEKAERRQPLHGHPERALQVVRVETVVLRGDAVGAEELELAAVLKHVADIKERAHAGRLRPFCRHREDELVLAGDAQTAAIRVAELILGP